MSTTSQDKFTRLRQRLSKCRSLLVAYSGGVDSAVLAAVAHEVLGDRMLACIGISPSLPQRELRTAVKLAEDHRIPLRQIEVDEHTDPQYAANPDNRCYFCKSHLFDRLREIASAEGWGAIADGNNVDDLGDDRPGMTAARQRGVISPLLDAGLTKADVRELGRQLGLEVWDKPAMACLASRVPHGTAITPELLKQIEQAEDVLAGLGFRQFRVRHHGDVARIELPAEELGRAVDVRQQLVSGIRALGYRHVTLDLAGFRGGAPLTPITVKGAGQ